MKNLILAFLFITTSALYLNAQNKEQTCHFGITFEISNNPNWGYGEPVVLSVEPYSPAEKAGIKVVQTNVGDRYVLEYMLEHGLSLGGEQSGHIVPLERTDCSLALENIFLAAQSLGIDTNKRDILEAIQMAADQCC